MLCDQGGRGGGEGGREEYGGTFNTRRIPGKM